MLPHQLHVYFVDYSKPCIDFVLQNVCYEYLVGKIWSVLLMQGVKNQFGVVFAIYSKAAITVPIHYKAIDISTHSCE